MAQSTLLEDSLPKPADCVGTPVTMVSCSAYLHKYTACFVNSDPTSQANCFCPQTVLNELAGCHQEWWDCYATSDVDTLFTGNTGLYAEWSTVCAEVLTYTPTMSSVNSAITIDGQPGCNQILSDCSTLSASISSCSLAYTADADLSNCLCNENMLYFGSKCDIDGPKSCLLTTLASASIYSNQVCGLVSGTAITSRLSSRLSSTTDRASPSSMYSPPTPSPTSPVASPTTSVASGNQAAYSYLHLMTLCLLATIIGIR